MITLHKVAAGKPECLLGRKGGGGGKAVGMAEQPGQVVILTVWVYACKK